MRSRPLKLSKKKQSMKYIFIKWTIKPTLSWLLIKIYAKHLNTSSLHLNFHQHYTSNLFATSSKALIKDWRCWSKKYVISSTLALLRLISELKISTIQYSTIVLTIFSSRCATFVPYFWRSSHSSLTQLRLRVISLSSRASICCICWSRIPAAMLLITSLSSKD